MKLRILAAMAVLGLMLAGSPSYAHHSGQAQFDFSKPIDVTGTVTRIEFINPHGYLYMESKDETGKVHTWAFELVGPAYLRKAGLGRGSGAIKIGDTLTVHAMAAKDGTDSGLTFTIKLADGRTVTVLTAADPNL
jgi:hypothetical protein